MGYKSSNYAVSRVKILEGRLIDKDRINRMIEADSAKEAYRILTESGYGAAADASEPRDFERLIDRELEGLGKFVEEISVDTELTDVLLMRTDYKNAKAYLKMRVMSSDVPEAVSDAGKVPSVELREMVYQMDTYGLPGHLSDAIAEAERQIAIDPSPGKIDDIMDKAYTKWAAETAKRKKNAFLTELLTCWADMNNILSLLRVREMRADTNFLRESLLEGGEISHEYILDAYTLNDDMLPLKFKHTRYGHELINAIEKALELKKAWNFEHYIENMFIALARKQRLKVFGIDPLLGYIIGKQAEATAVRMVMTGKINKMRADDIRERLRDLYV